MARKRSMNARLVQLVDIFQREHLGRRNRISIRDLARKLGWFPADGMDSPFESMVYEGCVRRYIHKARRIGIPIYTEGRMHAGYYIPLAEDYWKIEPYWHKFHDGILRGWLRVMEYHLNATSDLQEKIAIKEKVASILAYLETHQLEKR